MKDTLRLNKAEQQRVIARRNKQDTANTDRWLRSVGVSEEDLTQSNLLLLRAQKTAHELLLHHRNLIEDKDADWLSQFARRSKNAAQRQKITDGQCYAVLNYAKRINRKVFKLHRQLNTQTG